MALLSPYTYDPYGPDTPEEQGEPGPGGPTPGSTKTPGSTTPGSTTPGSTSTDPIVIETTAPGGSGGGGGGGGFSPSGLPNVSIPGVPAFIAPVFTRPNPSDVLASPGYQFRLGQGQQGIERSAAAKGLLRTGGTLKDIAEYNQNFASNEYQQEFNRALATFQTTYQGKKDEYAPLLAHWQAKANAALASALAAYNRDTVWYNPHAGGGGGGGGTDVVTQWLLEGKPNPPE